MKGNMELTPAARLLLERRYLLPGESPEGLFWRAASAVGGRNDRASSSHLSISFSPNSPGLMNGTPGGQPRRFVLPVEDSIEVSLQPAHMASSTSPAGGPGSRSRASGLAGT